MLWAERLPWLPLLVTVHCFADEQLWELHAKLVDAQDYPKLTEKVYPYLITPSLRAFSAHFFLVLREPHFNTCRWTNAIRITEDIVELGFSIDMLRTVNRCGPGFDHLCKFYDEPLIRRSPKLDAVFRSKAPNGYVGFLIGRYWAEEEPLCPHQLQSDEDPFIVMQHPFRRLHPKPDVWGEWLSRSLQYAGLDEWNPGNPGNPDEIVKMAVQAAPDVCIHSVQDAWSALWPQAPPKSMIVLGCSDMNHDPTSPLLEKGAGGLFIDVSSKLIENAQRKWSAPHRMILNIKAQPHNIAELLKNYSSYVEDVEVLQVDVDTMDGRLVEELLAHTKPRAVVVEVRDSLPFPFRYACLTHDTKHLPWGGANFAFWLHLLRRHGLHLVRMDLRDAVFARTEAPTIRTFLGAMACYLRKFVLVPTPLQAMELWTRKTLREIDRKTVLRHHWIASHPPDVIEEIWRNMTTTSPDVRFHLDV
ncbi:unnamed protein product [Cladocopium goreaui]|uniref:Serine/threonine-protein kinase CTR1 n=1 Tax=Cladocopium goreaui TaxID=2562237 RepID=A0A9P1FFM7_9DINO|nr:unnamed protein product [Cladocopium goreaui]|mmetsp:Transcript_33596/g.72386  ORF Transcript_33596/g.72386 Transcript_33596/m.72386 type:complete len:473 (+) Transcript_33596:61-1479(+)